MNTTLAFLGLQSQSNYDVLNIKAGSLDIKGSNQMQNEMHSNNYATYEAIKPLENTDSSLRSY